jgi:hypothetical protein
MPVKVIAKRATEDASIITNDRQKNEKAPVRGVFLVQIFGDGSTTSGAST